MCLNCGCGEPDKRHEPSDVTLEDVQAAADGQGSTLDETVANLSKSLRDIEASGSASGARPA